MRQIEELAHRLEALSDDLRPRPEVDAAFDDLVDLVLTTPDDAAAAALADPAVRRLRPKIQDLSARGEHQLERAWAGADDLAGFPYLHHYRLLVEAELAAVGPVRRVLFVGSGPLPLSPMLLARHGLDVDAVDRDPSAVAAAEKVVTGPRFRIGDVIHQHDLAGYDLVVVAALVDDKRRCLEHLAATLAPGAMVLARSAHGMRTLLYPAVELPLPDGFRLVDVVHPPPPVINSIVVAEVTAGAPAAPAPPRPTAAARRGPAASAPPARRRPAPGRPPRRPR